MADRKEYDNAISTLTEVPEVCKECYDKSMDLSVKIFKDKFSNFKKFKQYGERFLSLKIFNKKAAL